MKILEKKLSCALLSTNVIKDIRGWFRVAVNVDEIHEMGLCFEKICQINHAYTQEQGVVRGLNYQEEPYSQAKLVRCVKGALYSVGVDINPTSKTFGQYCGFTLTEENGYLMYIPRNYAHGYVTLVDDTELEYFTDNVFCATAAKSIFSMDPQIGIDWTCSHCVELKRDIVSEKNKFAPTLAEVFGI